MYKILTSQIKAKSFFKISNMSEEINSPLNLVLKKSTQKIFSIKNQEYNHFAFQKQSELASFLESGFGLKLNYFLLLTLFTNDIVFFDGYSNFFSLNDNFDFRIDFPHKTIIWLDDIALTPGKLNTKEIARFIPKFSFKKAPWLRHINFKVFKESQENQNSLIIGVLEDLQSIFKYPFKISNQIQSFARQTFLVIGSYRDQKKALRNIHSSEFAEALDLNTDYYFINPGKSHKKQTDFKKYLEIFTKQLEN